MARYREKQQKTLELLIYFTERFKISTECVCLYSCLSVVIWYWSMNYIIKSKRTMCCVFLYRAMLRGNQHGGHSMMTRKIDLIWRHMKTLYRGFSCDVISRQFCKSSYSRPPCWFPFAWPGIAKYNKMSHYFLFSSYHNTKLRPSEKNIKTYTRLKFQILL